MRGKFTVTLAVGLLVTSSMAFAATKTGKAASTKKALPSASAAAASLQVAPSAAPTPPPAGVQSLPQAGSPTTASAATADPESSPTALSATGSSTASMTDTAPKSSRKLKAEFSSYTFMPMAATNRGARDAKLISAAGFKYKLADTKSLALKQVFTYDVQTEKTQARAVVSDPYLSYSDSKLATFGEGSVIWTPRIYLPTGESSRFVTKQRGTLFSQLIATHPFGKFDVNYSLIGYYFIQSQDTYLNSKGELTANRNFRLINTAELTWNISDNLALTQSFSTDQANFHSGAPGKTRTIDFWSDTTLTILAPKLGLAVELGISDSIPVEHAETPFQLYREEDISYYASVAISI